MYNAYFRYRPYILDNLLTFVIDVFEIKSGEFADEFKSIE